MANEWKEVIGQESTMWDFKTDNELAGIYVEMQDKVGANESKVYTLENKDGRFSFWGSTVIDTKMKYIDLGEEVKVVYNGVITSDKTGREYKDYQVYHRHAETPVDVKKKLKAQQTTYPSDLKN